MKGCCSSIRKTSVQYMYSWLTIGNHFLSLNSSFIMKFCIIWIVKSFTRFVFVRSFFYVNNTKRDIHSPQQIWLWSNTWKSWINCLFIVLYNLDYFIFWRISFYFYFSCTISVLIFFSLPSFFSLLKNL